jgi:hypothetical protein
MSRKHFGITLKVRINNWVCMHYVRPPLWSSGVSSCLQIQRSGFASLRYQIFWEVVGLERGPLSLVSTTEELLERKSSGSGLESQEYGRWYPSRWQRGTIYPQTLAITSPTSGGRSVGIVRSRTQATEFSLVYAIGIKMDLKEQVVRMWAGFNLYPSRYSIKRHFMQTESLLRISKSQALRSTPQDDCFYGETFSDPSPSLVSCPSLLTQ